MPLIDSITELEINSGKVKSIKFLDEGYTAKVYTGDYIEGKNSTPVVIKMLQSDHIEDILMVKTIEDEAQFIQQLTERFRLKGIKYRIVPTYYGIDYFHGLPFIVMEKIQGENLKKSLDAKITHDEATALQIGLELFLTLRLMHDDLRKAYPDLKIDNLFVQTDQDKNPSLRMIDFGSLYSLEGTPDAEAYIQHDLLMASLSIFALLSGYSLVIRGGVNIESAEGKIDALQNVSWGMKEILKKLLSRVPCRRIAKADEAFRLINDLITWQNSSEEQLLKMLKINIDNCRNLPSDNVKLDGLIFKTNAMLDILVSKKPENKMLYETYVNKVDEITTNSDSLSLGKTMIKNQEYKKAREYFEKGKDLSTSSQVFRHWLYVTEELVGLNNQQAQLVSSEIFKLMDKVEDKEWITALEKIEEIVQSFPFLKLENLKNSILLAESYQKGCELEKSSRLEDALHQFKDATKFWKQMPDKDFILQYEFGDIQEKCELLNKQIQNMLVEDASKKEIENYQNAINNGELVKANKQLWELISKNNSYSKIENLLVEGIKTALSKGDINATSQFVRMVTYIPISSEELLNFYQLAKFILDFHNYLDQLKYDELITTLDEFQNFKFFYPDSVGFFKPWLEKIVANKLFQKRELFITKCQSVAERFNLFDLTNDFKILSDNFTDWKKKRCDELVNEYIQLINYSSLNIDKTESIDIPDNFSSSRIADIVIQIKNQENRLKNAESLLNQINNIDYRLNNKEYLDNLLEKAKEQFENDKKHHEIDFDKKDANKHKIINAWNLLKIVKDLLIENSSSEVSSIFQNTNSSISKMISEVKVQIFLFNLEYGEKDTEIESINKELNEFIQKYPQTRTILHSIAIQNKNEVLEILKELENQFTNCESLEKVTIQLDELEAYSLYVEEWHVLKKKVITAYILQEWQNKNYDKLNGKLINKQNVDDILKELKNLNFMSVPKKYWSSIEAYLLSLSDNYQINIKEQLNVITLKDILKKDFSGLVDDLFRWIEITNLLKENIHYSSVKQNKSGEEL